MAFHRKNNSYKFQVLKSNHLKEKIQFQIESLPLMKETRKMMMRAQTMMMERTMRTKTITEKNKQQFELNSFALLIDHNLFLIFIKEFFSFIKLEVHKSLQFSVELIF